MMETFKRPLARAPHSITAPDFPWAHIGGMFPYLEDFKAQLMADELVIWLEGFVPCRSCQTLGTYLRSLLSKSIPQLIEIIQQYELDGRTAVPTCQCGMRRKSLGGSAPPPLPPVTCRLNKHKSWHFDIDTPSTEAVQWIKNRLQEQHIEQTMRKSWKRYMSFFDVQGKLWAKANTSFTPWAQFPRRRSPLVAQTMSDITFGPCQLDSKQTDGLILVLKWAELAPPMQPAAERWMAYLDRYPSRPIELNRGPPLTAAIGTMVLEPSFGDSDALALFEGCLNCEVEIHSEADMSWGDFARSKERAHRLTDIHGVTVLYLGCFVINDQKACKKLLQMKETGATILWDFLHNKYIDMLAGRLEDCLLPLVTTAMNVDTEWTVHNLSGNLLLLFTANIRLSRFKDFPLHSTLALKDLLATFISLSRREELELVPRLFAPSTEEGWEDGADVATTGVLYGTALGTVVLVSLKGMEERNAETDSRSLHTDLSQDWSEIGRGILGAVTETGAKIDPEGGEWGFLEGIYVPSWSHGDLLELCDFLKQVRGSLLSIAASYCSQVDTDHLLQAAQRAFGAVVSNAIHVPAATLHTFFGTERSITVVKLVERTKLRDGRVQRHNRGFAREMFRDMATLNRCVYSEQDLRERPRFRDCWQPPSPAHPHPSLTSHDLAVDQDIWQQPGLEHRTQLEQPRSSPDTAFTRPSTPEDLSQSNRWSMVSGYSSAPTTPSSSIYSPSRKPSLMYDTPSTFGPPAPVLRVKADAHPSTINYPERSRPMMEQLLRQVYARSVAQLPTRVERKENTALDPKASESSSERHSVSHQDARPSRAAASDHKQRTTDSSATGNTRRNFQGRIRPGPKSLMILFLVVILLLMLWFASGGHPTATPEFATFYKSSLSDHSLPLPAGRVRQSFPGGLYSHPPGSVVCIVPLNLAGFYSILDIDGRIDVSATFLCIS